MRRDERYRVQTRGAGERGWRTEAVIADVEAATREAMRLVDQRGRGGVNAWRTHTHVRVMQGDELFMAWSYGRPVPSAMAQQAGGAA